MISRKRLLLHLAWFLAASTTTLPSTSAFGMTSSVRRQRLGVSQLSSSSNAPLFEDLAFSDSVSHPDDELDTEIRDDLKRELLLLASVTNRGEYATDEEITLFIDLVQQLEALNPTRNPSDNCEGTWDLCLGSTQLIRSSPFVQAVRMMATTNSNLSSDILDMSFEMFDRATSSISRIGRVRQVILPVDMEDEQEEENETSFSIPDIDANGEIKDANGSTSIFQTTPKIMTSYVEVEMGMLPGLPLRTKGTVVTKADLEITSSQHWDLSWKETKLEASPPDVPVIGPFFQNFLRNAAPFDMSELPSPVQGLYNLVQENVPVVTMKTCYVDEGLRITRDIDDNFFVFTRV